MRALRPGLIVTVRLIAEVVFANVLHPLLLVQALPPEPIVIQLLTVVVEYASVQQTLPPVQV